MKFAIFSVLMVVIAVARWFTCQSCWWCFLFAFGFAIGYVIDEMTYTPEPEEKPSRKPR